MKLSDIATTARHRLLAAQTHSVFDPVDQPVASTDASTDSDVRTAQLEVDVLLQFVTGRSRSTLYAWPDATLSSNEIKAFNDLVEERIAGQPLAYLTGQQEFWSLPFDVSSDVLIPRPETELLVETAIDYLHNLPAADVLELGTGSGAIAIALANEQPQTNILATDVSSDALSIAQANADKVSASLNKQLRIKFLQSDWFEAIYTMLADSKSALTSDQTGQTPLFDLIISNPPYLSEDDPHLTESIRFEPRNALVSGVSGLESLQTIASGARMFLYHNGMLALEHGYDQAEAVRLLLQNSGYNYINTHRDLAGIERVTTGLWITSTATDNT